MCFRFKDERVRSIVRQTTRKNGMNLILVTVYNLWFES